MTMIFKKAIARRTFLRGVGTTLALPLLDGMIPAFALGSDSAKVNWATIDKFSPYGGIRVEDNVRATNGACENLTRDAFATL